MSRFAAARSTCMIAMVLAIGTASVPLPAAAARVSKADEIALKEAIVACKAEAKGKKMGWLAGRKYVNKCVAEALKGRPNVNVNQMLKDHPDMKEEKWDSI
jgi:hypothetical protein